MSKKSPLDILNMMAGAAHKKSQQAGDTSSPDDENDPKNSLKPKAKKSPASKSSKQVAAIKEQNRGHVLSPDGEM